MTLTSTHPSGAIGAPLSPPVLARRHPVALVASGQRRWRVLEPGGRIIGHLRTEDHAWGVRYLAERYLPAAARFRELGAFWSADDAVDCLRAA